MQLSSNKKPGSMVAFIGINENELIEICNQNEIVVPANINSLDQIVISGTIDGIENSISFNESSAFIPIPEVIKSLSSSIH